MSHHQLEAESIGIAHSKLILIGEHSVVYGLPAIALPFPSLKVRVKIRESLNQYIHFQSEIYSGPLNKLPGKLKGLRFVTEEILKRVGHAPKGLTITLQSEIPIGRGLGSSAAIAIALVRSLYNFFKQELTHKQLMEWVQIGEKYAHGNPSGIDMEAASRMTPIWFKKGEEPTPIEIGSSFYLVVADTGQSGDTKEAVSSIRQKYEADYEKMKTSIDLLGDYTHQARKALVDGAVHKLGKLLTLAHSELDKLGVSNQKLNHLVEAACKAGAIGAKLTGGGRGGCMIALVENLNNVQAVRNELINAGAKNTWYFHAKEDKPLFDIL